MGVARSVTQRLIRSSAFPALATLGGWLRLDRLVDGSSRWLYRGQARMLTPSEIHEAQLVFDNSIPYEDVRIVEASRFAQRIAAISERVHLPQGEGLAVTVFLTIHFSTELQRNNGDMPWLIHELTHVWQYCRVGPRYLVDALQTQSEHGKEAYEIAEGLTEGWAWEQFNPEQQSNVARAYYRALKDKRHTSAYQPYIDVLKSAKRAR